nr:MAG TPA: hypothetical protein [Caudoviricetes sp.]
MPLRITSVRETLCFKAYSTSFLFISLSIRTLILIHFGLSDFGLPVFGLKLSPHFLRSDN